MAETILLWSDRALTEYEELLSYVWDVWGENVMIRIADDVETNLKRIKSQPEQFPIVPNRPSIRRCVFSAQTSIFFSYRDNIVKIASIFDNRQNPRKLRGIR